MEQDEIPPGRPVILVVDDEAAVRAFLCDYLRHSAFHSFGVGTADTAIHLLQQALAADLVFSDVRIPGDYDGYGLARWIAEHRPGLPVILTTGTLGSENAPELHHQAEMLLKPYALDHAVNRIRQSIARRAAR